MKRVRIIIFLYIVATVSLFAMEDKIALLKDAISSKNIDVIKNLVQDYSIDVNQEDATGMPPLCWAIDAQSVEIVDFFLQQGALVNQVLFRRHILNEPPLLTRHQVTIIDYAFERYNIYSTDNNYTIIKKLIISNVQPEPVARAIFGNSPWVIITDGIAKVFHYAIQRDDRDCIDALIDIVQRSAKNKNPIMFNMNDEVTRIPYKPFDLLNKNIVNEIFHEGKILLSIFGTPLYTAMVYNDKLFTFLVSQGARLEDFVSQDLFKAYTPTDDPALINQPDAMGRTLLMYHVWKGDIQRVCELLCNDANPLLQMKVGLTVFDIVNAQITKYERDEATEQIKRYKLIRALCNKRVNDRFMRLMQQQLPKDVRNQILSFIVGVGLESVKVGEKTTIADPHTLRIPNDVIQFLSSRVNSVPSTIQPPESSSIQQTTPSSLLHHGNYTYVALSFGIPIIVAYCAYWYSQQQKPNAHPLPLMDDDNTINNESTTEDDSLLEH